MSDWRFLKPPIRVPEDSTWRPIPGWPGYWMNQYSQIFVMKSGRVLLEWSNRWYDMYVTLRRDGKAYSRKVKALYTLTFGDIEKGEALADEDHNDVAHSYG